MRHRWSPARDWPEWLWPWRGLVLLDSFAVALFVLRLVDAAFDPLPSWVSGGAWGWLMGRIFAFLMIVGLDYWRSR